MAPTPQASVDPSDLGHIFDASVVTPLAGGGPGAVNVLTTVTLVSVIAAAGDSLTLPRAYPGAWIMIFNGDPALELTVYPAPGELVGPGAADEPFLIAAASAVIMAVAVTGFWLVAAPPPVVVDPPVTQSASHSGRSKSK